MTLEMAMPVSQHFAPHLNYWSDCHVWCNHSLSQRRLLITGNFVCLVPTTREHFPLSSEMSAQPQDDLVLSWCPESVSYWLLFPCLVQYDVCSCKVPVMTGWTAMKFGTLMSHSENIVVNKKYWKHGASALLLFHITNKSQNGQYQYARIVSVIEFACKCWISHRTSTAWGIFWLNFWDAWLMF